jgi:hypothetical protein
MAKAHDTPSDVTADDGEVHIDGPGGVTVSMTPDAAAETSDRLLAGATQAQGQKVRAQELREQCDRRRHAPD